MTLTRYILGRYLAAFAITLPVFILLYWLIDLFEIVGDFMKLSGGMSLMLSFYLAKLPMVLYQILPVAGVFASIFTIGSMKRHGELIATAALGLPLWRIVVPFLLPLILIGSGTGLIG